MLLIEELPLCIILFLRGFRLEENLPSTVNICAWSRRKQAEWGGAGIWHMWVLITSLVRVEWRQPGFWWRGIWGPHAWVPLTWKVPGEQGRRNVLRFSQLKCFEYFRDNCLYSSCEGLRASFRNLPVYFQLLAPVRACKDSGTVCALFVLLK